MTSLPDTLSDPTARLSRLAMINTALRRLDPDAQVGPTASLAPGANIRFVGPIPGLVGGVGGVLLKGAQEDGGCVVGVERFGRLDPVAGAPGAGESYGAGGVVLGGGGVAAG